MSYRALFRDRTYRRLILATAGGRLGQVMFDVTIVLFGMNELQQPVAAGFAVLLSTLPGLILSPLAGSFLKGRDLTRWMTVDFALKGVATLGIAYGAGTHAGGIALMLALATLMSVTSAFGSVALRSYIALAVDPDMRGCANGIDSVSAGLAALVGPVFAAITVAMLAGRNGLAVVGIIYLAAAATAVVSGRTLLESGTDARLRAAARAVWSIVVVPTLRGLTAVYFLYQAAIGVLVIALPILIGALHGANPSWVGWCWSVAGGCAVLAALGAGRMVTPGRERGFMVIGIATTSLAVASLLLPGTAWWILGSFLVLGAGAGPIDVGLMGLRQSVLPRHGATAILAVSSSVNMSGYPVGAFVGGIVAALGPTALVVASLSCSALGLVSALLLPTAPRGYVARHAPGRSNTDVPKPSEMMLCDTPAATAVGRVPGGPAADGRYAP